MSTKLLNKIIEASKLTRDDIYICNFLRCRPPGNRTPRPDEIGNCFAYLEAQIETIRPTVICTLGAPATKTLLGTERGLGGLRGRVHRYRDVDVVPTYHPAYLLRYPAEKVKTWHDIQLVAKLLQKK